MGKLKVRYLSLALATFIGASCSSLDRVALNSTSKILDKGSKQINYEPDWHFFKEAAPANIKMIEGMSFADPENIRFLGLLAKAYGGYAYGIRETMYLGDVLGDSSSTFNRDQAISAYTKGLKYGLRYLDKKGITKKDVYSKDAAKDLPKLLAKLGDEDMEAVFYTGQSLGGLINLQKGNVGLLSRIGAAKAMMDWVCQRDMDFEGGACLLFYGMYEAARPAMLGGNLEKGKKIFLKAIKKFPYNLLARVSYIQYYVIPMMDDVEYAKQREILTRDFKDWEQVKNAGANGKGARRFRKHPQYNLYNAIAQERFKIIEKHKKNIF